MSASQMLIELETKFWNSLVQRDTEAALDLLADPALIVGTHGAMQFDHDGYRNMADNAPRVLTAFELSQVKVVFPKDAIDLLAYRVKQQVASRGESQVEAQEMHDTSTWVKRGDRWQCVMHTETPALSAPASSG
jgi:hypothetical protein